MNDILKKHGFIKMEEFIEHNLNIKIEANDIYIRCTVKTVPFKVEKLLSNIDILEISLESVDTSNHLANGYNKSSKQWYYPNTSRNLLKTHKWCNIFNRIGDECSIFILTKCTVIEKVEDHYVYICGNIGDLLKSKEPARRVKRELLFHGKSKIDKLSLEDIEEDIYSDLKQIESIKAFSRININEMISNFNSLNLISIYKSFFNERSKKNARNKNKQHIYYVDSDESVNLKVQTKIIQSNSTHKLSSNINSKVNYQNIHEQESLNSSDKTSILKDAIEPEIIVDFLFLISKKILKPVLNYESFKILKGKLTILIKKNSYESLTFEELKKYFKFSKMKIFDRKVSKYELVKQIKVGENLMMYIFNNIFIKLISFFFYTTTSGSTRFKLFFFHRNEWNAKTNVFLNEYLKDYETCEGRQRVASLRCIPRTTGFRVITNCAKSPNNKRFNSINSQVGPIVPILREEFVKKYENTLLGYIDIKDRLYGFLNKTKGRFYLLKIDLSKCFDNISHEGLINLIHRSFKEDFYFSSEYSIFHLNKFTEQIERKILKKSSKIFMPVNTYNSSYFIPEFKKSLNILFNNEILNFNMQNKAFIVKENKYKTYTRNELITALINTVGNTVVAHQNSFYRITKGIPQGCSLSPLLCNIFYADVYIRYFKKIFSSGTVLRYVDDFLLISEDIDELKEFLKISRGLKYEGFIINDDKIESTSKDLLDFMGIVRNEKNYINWCGLKVYDKGIAIKTDFNDPYFRFYISLPADNVGVKIFEKLKKSFILKTNEILINRKNSKLGENIFDAFYFVARRIKILFLRANFINFNFVRKIYNFLVDYMKMIIKSRRIRFDESKIDMIACKVSEMHKLFEFSKKCWK